MIVLRIKGIDNLWKLFSFLLLWMQVLSNVPGVMAIEVPDLTKTGELSVTFKKDEAPISGGSLTIYHVGDIHRDDGNDSFVLSDAFVGSNLQAQVNNVTDSTLAAAFQKYATDNNIVGTTGTIGSDGKVSFKDLKLGL